MKYEGKTLEMPGITSKLLSHRPHSKLLKIKISKTIIFPLDLRECELLSLSLREDHKLRMFERKLLRKIFGSKNDKVSNIAQRGES
jgi:hypothetical protein